MPNHYPPLDPTEGFLLARISGGVAGSAQSELHERSLHHGPELTMRIAGLIRGSPGGGASFPPRYYSTDAGWIAWLARHFLRCFGWRARLSALGSGFRNKCVTRTPGDGLGEIQVVSAKSFKTLR